jgi:hypothetical protein
LLMKILSSLTGFFSCAIMACFALKTDVIPVSFLRKQESSPRQLGGERIRGLVKIGLY